MIVPTTLTLALAAATLSLVPSPGAPGIGDPYFPKDGNGGIDVKSYDVHDRYRIDVVPTILELFGKPLPDAASPDALSGVSLLPDLAPVPGREPARRPIFIASIPLSPSPSAPVFWRATHDPRPLLRPVGLLPYRAHRAVPSRLP